MLFRVAETVGEVDVDALAEMPMPLLREWVEYIGLRHAPTDGQGTPRKGARLTSPAHMQAMLKARYGGRSGT